MLWLPRGGRKDSPRRRDKGKHSTGIGGTESKTQTHSYTHTHTHTHTHFHTHTHTHTHTQYHCTKFGTETLADFHRCREVYILQIHNVWQIHTALISASHLHASTVSRALNASTSWLAPEHRHKHNLVHHNNFLQIACTEPKIH